MASPFVAEIRIFPFNFAPTGWATCDGQLLPISQNTALFSLLGTNYGGNGTSTFGLPNLDGSVPLHVGGGAGLGQPVYDLGQTGGEDTLTLLISEMPAHSHAIQAGIIPSNLKAPNSSLALSRSSGGDAYVTPASAEVSMAANLVSPAGGGQAHNNLMPYLTLTFCIALQGIFPPRS